VLIRPTPVRRSAWFGIGSVLAARPAACRSLSPATLEAFVRGAREIREQGTFGFAAEALPDAKANDLVAEQ
jgi:hypothetical protein